MIRKIYIFIIFTIFCFARSQNDDEGFCKGGVDCGDKWGERSNLMTYVTTDDVDRDVQGENNPKNLKENGGKIVENPADRTEKQPIKDPINVMFTFVNAVNNHKLQRNFHVAVSSLLGHCSVPVKVFVVADDDSKSVARKIISESVSESESNSKLVEISFIDFDSTSLKFHSQILHLQHHFSPSSNSYYSNALFFLSIFTHLILPPSISRIILLDSDIKFRSDITHLYGIFNDFEDDNIMGLARENQPVYHHLLSTYRNHHPSTIVGGPPPHGQTGFNSGVVLMDLERMRRSGEYGRLMEVEAYARIAEEYSFKGHLGDQDFYTLLSFTHPHLFHTLPCQWNRQLCQWWFNNGYNHLLHQYHHCPPPIHLYHGNCDTPIP